MHFNIDDLTMQEWHWLGALKDAVTQKQMENIKHKN